MRPGRVTQIRVSPKDCMSIIDVLDRIQLYRSGMSFAQATSVVLACAIETFRKQSLIPTRDGFEYSSMMQRFPADTIITRGRKTTMPDIAQLEAPILTAAPADQEYKLRERLSFLVEAQTIRELTPQEDEEFVRLNKELFHE